MSRIVRLREYIDEILVKMGDNQNRRCAYIHLYGVSQACALIALKRNQNVELATMAGMLHDLYTYKNGDSRNHAEKGAILAREILNELELTNEEETDLICKAIHHHSSKVMKYDAFTEVLIDADVMQHGLFDYTKPIQKHEEDRFSSLMTELGIQINNDR